MTGKTRWRRRLSGAVAAAAMAATASAAAADSCWTRAYSAEHLAAHPGQDIVAMTLTIDSRPDPAFGALTIRLRDGRVMTESLLCQRRGGAFAFCGVVCDGGRFSITHRASDGAVLLRNGDRGLAFAGCDLEIYHLRNDAEHSAFRLFRC